jgi:hypothetical protein
MFTICEAAVPQNTATNGPPYVAYFQVHTYAIMKILYCIVSVLLLAPGDQAAKHAKKPGENLNYFREKIR